MGDFFGTAKLVMVFVTIIATLITSWILGVRMRRRIRRAIGTNIQSEAELTSLNTWMKVEEVEQEKRDGSFSQQDR